MQLKEEKQTRRKRSGKHCSTEKNGKISYQDRDHGTAQMGGSVGYTVYEDAEAATSHRDIMRQMGHIYVKFIKVKSGVSVIPIMITDEF